MYVDNGGISKHGLPPHTTTSKLQLNYRTTALASVALWIQCRIVNQMVTGLIPSLECLGCRPGPH